MNLLLRLANPGIGCFVGPMVHHLGASLARFAGSVPQAVQRTVEDGGLRMTLQLSDFTSGSPAFRK